MGKKNTVILNQLAERRSDLVGFSRFLSNDKITPDTLVRSAIHRCNELAKGRHVLVINDTTDFNFRDHQNFLDPSDEHLGPMSNEGDMGFYLHPGLVIDAEHEMSLGFSAIKIWNRAHGQKNKHERNYISQPFEQKEGYRWIECGVDSKRNISSAAHITIIADREADIYQEFALIPDHKTDLIIRSCQNRILKDSESKLYETLTNVSTCGSYPLKVRANQNGKREGRNTMIEVRFTKVDICKPTTAKDKSLPDSKALYAIEARENIDYVPKGDKPICWRLLTTYTVNDFERALKIIKWYAMRWQIELLFGTMKSKGLNLESSEIESGSGLKNLCLISMQVALKINQLSQARDNENGLSAKIIFSARQIVLLKSLVMKFEGNTEKQKNHYQEGSLAWASWVIARMGGWKGYDSESKPGNKTMRIGLTSFDNIFLGWNLKT